jgi:DNA-directed RNA polymerase subunit RPC12/RpoP
MYRYVCPKCLHTFLSRELLVDPYCWECNHSLEVIPRVKKEKEDEEE